MEFLIIFVMGAVGSMAFFTSKLIAPRLFTDSGCVSVLARLALGTAIVVCSMNFFLHYFTGWSAAWITFCGLLITSLLAHRKIKSIKLDGHEGGAAPITAPMYILIALLIIWRLLSIFKLGQLTPFEGTGNHDELWYIFVAQWLTNHGLNQSFVTDPLFPFEFASGINLTTLPRIGSESLLTFIAVLSGGNIPQVYVLLFAWASTLLLGMSALGLLVDTAWTPTRLTLALFVIALSPVYLFIFGNQNFSTCFGLAFLAAHYWFLQQGLETLDKRTEIVASGFFLGALISTYPELLAVAVPASLVLVAQSIISHRATKILGIVKNMLLLIVVTTLCAPLAINDAFKVLTTASGAIQGQNIIMPDLFESIRVWNFGLTLVTFATPSVQAHLGSIGVGLASVALYLVLFQTSKKIFSATLGLLVGCTLVFCLFWVKNYGYGGMKAIEFFSLPLSVLIAGATARWLPLFVIPRKSLSLLSKPAKPLGAMDWYKPILAVLVLAIVAAVSVARTINYNRVAMAMHLPEELLELNQARFALGANSLLYVDESLGGDSFLTSRWIAYVLRGTPMVFAPPLHQGGYIYNLDLAYKSYFPRITTVLRATPLSGEKLPSAIYRNSRFEILPIESVGALFGSGFYGNEGWGRWMGQSADIDIFGQCSGELRLEILSLFQGASGQESIEISSDSEMTKVFDLPGGHGIVTFPLAGHSHEVIHVKSLATAKSPRDLGLSLDSRELTFSFGTAKVSQAGRCSR